MSSKARFEGYLLTDHSQGPGVAFYSQTANSPLIYRAETKVEQATLWCCHCSACFLPNPDRDRQREYCRYCDNYLCDPCARTAKKADYIHRSFHDIAAMVKSGRWTIVGSISDQNLIPTFIEV